MKKELPSDWNNAKRVEKQMQSWIKVAVERGHELENKNLSEEEANVLQNYYAEKIASKIIEREILEDFVILTKEQYDQLAGEEETEGDTEEDLKQSEEGYFDEDEECDYGVKKQVKEAILQAFTECHVDVLTKNDLISEINAQYPNNRYAESTLQNFVYHALKYLMEEGVVERFSRGKYKLVEDFDLNKMYNEDREIMDELCRS